MIAEVVLRTRKSFLKAVIDVVLFLPDTKRPDILYLGVDVEGIICETIVFST